MPLFEVPRMRPWLVRQAPFLIIALLYAIAYLKLVHGHGVVWRGWSDQGRYLRSATAFSEGRFDAGDHWYPLLYPLLGAPFVAVWPDTPFAPVDLICFVAAFAGFIRVCRHFRLGPWVALLIFAVSTVLYPEIGRRWLEPWTTTPSAALIWLGLGLALDVLDGPVSIGKAAAFGLCLALLPMARPADVLLAAVLGGISAMFMGRRRETRALAVFVATGIGGVAAYLGLHAAIYGLTLSNYQRLSAAFGENFAWLPWKAYLILVDPKPWFPDGEGLLQACPWLPIGAAGLVATCIRRGDQRRAAICVASAVSIYLAVMLAYVDLLPSGLWRFNNVHYFKWLLPVFGLFSVTFVRDLTRAPVLNLSSLCALLLLSCVRLVPEEVDGDHPARELVFAGRSEDFRTVYFARSSISDRMGEQRNVLDYHQIATGDGRMVAVALKRDFAGREVWKPSDAKRPWPDMGGDFYTDMKGAGATASPALRLAPRIGFGMPTWLTSRGRR
jgi:hypothetical protein